MPTYRSITLSLVSQFDILTIPEYAPLSTSNDPFSPLPTLVDPTLSLVSVYVPSYPSSLFWLSYSVSPPHPPHALYYFKLFLNNSHIVSWGCGEEDKFSGKTMFGVYGTGTSWSGEPGMEKRVFCFASEDHGKCEGQSDGDVMEVTVYRAKARKQVWPEVKLLKEPGKKGESPKKGEQHNRKGAVNLINAGILGSNHPKRYYKYALIDPTDRPFASFRYYYRTWDQLESLGVIPPSSEAYNDDDDAYSTRTTATQTTTSLPTRNHSPNKPALSTSGEQTAVNDTHPTRTTATPPPSFSSPHHHCPPTHYHSSSSASSTDSIHTAHDDQDETLTSLPLTLPSRAAATLTPPPAAIFPLPRPDPSLTMPSPIKSTLVSSRTPTPDAAHEQHSQRSRFRKPPSSGKSNVSISPESSPVKQKENEDSKEQRRGRARAGTGSMGLLRGVVASAVRRRGTLTSAPTSGLD